MHILANILRCKSNQTMQVGQLIDYNFRIIFIQKWYRKCGGESIEHISGSIV